MFWDVKSPYFHTVMSDPYFHTTMPDPKPAAPVPGERVDTPQREMYEFCEESTPVHHEDTEEPFESLFPDVEGFHRASSLERETGAVNNGAQDSTCVSNFTLRDEKKEYQKGESNYPQSPPETVSLMAPLAITY